MSDTLTQTYDVAAGCLALIARQEEQLREVLAQRPGDSGGVEDLDSAEHQAWMRKVKDVQYTIDWLRLSQERYEHVHF
jgi:hypothetical protein